MELCDSLIDANTHFQQNDEAKDFATHIDEILSLCNVDFLGPEDEAKQLVSAVARGKE